MLYQFRELQRATWLPLNLLAEATRATFRNPRLAAACAPLSGPIVAGAEVAERFTRHFGKPEWRLPVTGIDGDAVTVRETVVARKPFCTLIHFNRDTDREDPVVLVVAPLSGHHATLLRGTVEALLPDHDVYVTDWLDASRVPLARGRFDLDDYIAYVVEFLRLLGPEVHVLAVCQPVVPVLAAVSLMAQDDDPRQPRSMVLMGGPVDASTPATRVTELAMSRPLDWFERTVIQTVPAHLPGAGRRVYPGFLQLAGFMSMNPDRHIDVHVTLFQDLARGDDDGAERHRKFYDEYLSVLDLPAEFYLQTVRQVFQEHALARGTLRWRGEPVNPAAIRRTALM